MATGKAASSLGKTGQEKSSMAVSVITNLDLRGNGNAELPF